MSIKSIFFISTVLLLGSCQTKNADVEAIKTEAIEEYTAKQDAERQKKLDVIEKFYGVFATGDFSVLPEILDENYTQYPADPGQTPDIAGFKKHAEDFAGMFSDLQGAPTHILVDGDLVHVRSELELTHSGEAFGISPTNKRIKVTAFDTHHFNKDGKIDKTWHLEDFWGAYSQIK